MKKLILIFMIAGFVMSNLYSQESSWSPVGPIKFPTSDHWQTEGIGRCTQLKFHPSNPNKMYVASASGGLWMSVDKGNNWTSMNTDQVAFAKSASVAIDPKNDKVIYWGTGDPNYYSTGLGVYKTIDEGKTWFSSSNGMGNELVVEILIDPTNSNIVLAATGHGIYKSTDAGANWKLKTPSGGFHDMVYKPGNSKVVYACTKRKFYRSINAGDTWTEISDGLVMNGGGARIAVSPDNPEVVYVGVTVAYGTIFKSTNSGTSFESMRTEMSNNLVDYFAGGTGTGQANYNYDIGADPNDANKLFLCSHTIWNSTDGGATWNHKQPNWAVDLHTDQHHILINPYVPNEIWNTNDGGVYKNTNDGAGYWTPMSDGIAATEIYHGANSHIHEKAIGIGTQDNGAMYYKDGEWIEIAAGDVFSRHQTDYGSNHMYYNDKDGRVKDYISGTTKWLNLPFKPSKNKVLYGFAPSDGNIGYAVDLTDKKVYRTANLQSDRNTSWTELFTCPASIRSIQVDTKNPSLVYVLASNAKIYRFDNAQTSSNYVTLSSPVSHTGKEALSCSGTSGVLYLGRYDDVKRSDDKGETWTDFGTGLPRINSFKKLLSDPKSTIEAVYFVSEIGVYYRDKFLDRWVNYSKGLPIIALIADAGLYNTGVGQGYLRVFYYGRGVWETPLVNIDNDISVAITSPANNSTYTYPSSIQLSASASTKSNKITKVEFYDGEELLGVATSSPYVIDWEKVNIGQRSIMAVAYNDKGGVKFSNKINVNVTLDCNLLEGDAFGTDPPYASGREYDKAFDGNTATFFDFSKANGGYTGLDFGTVKKIIAVRYYPRERLLGRMVGGKFQGSNSSDFSSDVEDIGTVTTTPILGWNEIAVKTSKKYRYVRYVSPNNGYCNVAEIEFCGGSNLPPSVELTSPANNTLYPLAPTTIKLVARASDEDGSIDKVDFYHGTILLGSDNSAPYTYSWAGVGAGTYQITAVAIDDEGQKSTSQSITIYVEERNCETLEGDAFGTDPPWADGRGYDQAFDGNISTFFDYSKGNGGYTGLDFGAPRDILAIRYYPRERFLGRMVGGKFQGSNVADFSSGVEDLITVTTQPTLGWNEVAVNTTKKYRYVRYLSPNNGFCNVSEIEFCGINNQPPKITINSPANNTSYQSAPTTVTFEAKASDEDGSISQVSFYNGKTLLGVDKAYPYSYSWENIGFGTYQVTAVATDNEGREGVSEDVTIHVENSDCSGQVNGAAFIDSCGTCAGGSTGIIPILDKNACITSIAEDYDRLISIYPNPTIGDFKIDLSVLSGSSALIDIHSLEGKRVYTKSVLLVGEAVINDIDLIGIPDGVYIVSIRTDEYQTTRKIKIQSSVKPKMYNHQNED